MLLPPRPAAIQQPQHLLPWHQPALLQRVNRLLSLLIYAILFFMGTSLAPCASATADSAGDAAAATASGDPAATAPAASSSEWMVGYLLPWHQPALLQRVNRLLSLLIYAILFFMGTRHTQLE
jgi:uncharacterized membrane protein YbjE (DUF340 family)